MKRMKKVFAMLLAFAMVMGMSITSFAQEDGIPDSDDSKDVIVTGITETDVTVKAYKIVDANYRQPDGIGFLSFSWADGCDLDQAVFTEDDELNITGEELAGLTSKIDGLEDFDLTKSGANYTANLKVGAYMVLVTGAPDVVFNPMIVSVYYSSEDGSIVTEELDATSSWELAAKNAYAKSSSSTVDKNIMIGDSKVKGDDAAYDEIVTFKLDGMTFPSYSAQYGAVKYNVIDTMSAGLSFAEKLNLVVTVDGETAVVNEDYTFNASEDTKVLTVEFVSSFIKDNPLAEIEITYDAFLNEDAALDEAGNTNTVKVQYTNNPETNEVLAETEEAVTYHYSFDFKLEKVDFTDQTQTLNGAEFKLFDGENVIRTETTEEGVLTFAGLDAGTYTFKETKAPTGYKLDETVHTVDIETSYFEDGTLKSYIITIDKGTDNESVIEQYVKDETSKEVKTEAEAPITITNTKLSALPSTGGIGTAVFTIGGCAIMIAAAYFFFVSRKKEA